MIGRAMVWVGAAVLAVSVAACGEKPQRMDTAARNVDTQPWIASDAANPAFYASGWKVGDKASWEDQMRKRNQAQNEYVPR